MNAADRQRLSTATLALARPEVELPRYDRAALRPGIVHLGIGAFARCHLAAATEGVLCGRARAGQSLDWGIVGVSLRRPEQQDLLAPQDGLYTTIERSADRSRARIIGALTRVLVAPEDPVSVVNLLASTTTRIVTLTVTEKGYCHDPVSGQLRFDHPDIQGDMANPERPKSAIGFIVEALRRRRESGPAPFTVVSCDNLLGNGQVLERLVMAMAERRDASLAHWIAETCKFPSTMVDRIVPAPTETDRRDAEAMTGLRDAAALSHEPFLQWLIEDKFVNDDRPDWENYGAEMVDDVEPYERMKLRILNAAHSALAYLGYMAGHETISDVIADPPFRAFCTRLWQSEVIPTLDRIDRHTLERYAETLMMRFANPSIRHRTWQIAMDGSQKVPVRLVPTIEARARAGLTSPCASLALAAWIMYVAGTDERGGRIDVRDPLAETLMQILTAAGGGAEQQVNAALSLGGVFSQTFATNLSIRDEIIAAYRHLRAVGARAAVNTT